MCLFKKGLRLNTRKKIKKSCKKIIKKVPRVFKRPENEIIYKVLKQKK